MSPEYSQGVASGEMPITQAANLRRLSGKAALLGVMLTLAAPNTNVGIADGDPYTASDQSPSTLEAAPTPTPEASPTLITSPSDSVHARPTTIHAVKRTSGKKIKHIAYGHCTTIRKRPQEIILGTACTKNASAEVVGDGHRALGWEYSLLKIRSRFRDGSTRIIYKCGYVQEGILPNLQADPSLISACAGYFVSLTTQSTGGVFRRVNCPDILQGIQACRGPAHGKKPDADFADPELYGNYASAGPSPTNVLGNGPGGLSDPIRSQKKKLVHFRARTNDGKADVVMGSKWGFMVKGSTADLRGGPISLFSPEQLQQIKADIQKRQLYWKIKHDQY